MSVESVIRHVEWRVEEIRNTVDGEGRAVTYRCPTLYRFEPGDGLIDVTVIREGDNPRRPAQRMQMSIAEASHLIDGLGQIAGQAARNQPSRTRS